MLFALHFAKINAKLVVINVYDNVILFGYADHHCDYSRN